MQMILKVVSLLALIALIAPAIGYLAGQVTLEKMKTVMLVATLVWFATATPVMWKAKG